jgi:hypothetical protein
MANQGKNTEFPEAHSQHMQTMLECMSVCVSCAKKCLEEGHKRTAALCAECADICTLAIKAGSGRSEFEHEIMELCANVCKKCADECKNMQAKHCQECAEVCKRCADACSGVHSHR